MPPVVRLKRESMASSSTKHRLDDTASDLSRPAKRRKAPTWSEGNHATTFVEKDLVRYRVKILEHKIRVGKKGGHWYKVHFQGWRDSHDKWIAEADLDADDDTIPTGGRHEYDEEQLFVIEKIIDYRDIKVRGKKTREFFVKWDGYAPKFNTWEPEENLGGAHDMLERFKAKNDLLPPQPLKAKSAAPRGGRKSTSKSTPKAATKIISAKASIGEKSALSKNQPKASAKRKKRRDSAPPDGPLALGEVDMVFAGVSEEEALAARDFFPATESTSTSTAPETYTFVSSGPFGSGFYRRPANAPAMAVAAAMEAAAAAVDEVASVAPPDTEAGFTHGDDVESSPIDVLHAEDVCINGPAAELKRHKAALKGLAVSHKMQCGLSRGADPWVLSLTLLSTLLDTPASSAKLTWLRQELRALRAAVPHFRAVTLTHIAHRAERVASLGRSMGLVVFEVTPLHSAADVQQLVREFEAHSSVPRLLVATIRGVASEMAVSATRVYLMEPSTDPTAEVSAVRGIARDGSVEGQLVKRMCLRGSVEERIVELRTKYASGAAVLRHGRVAASDVHALLQPL